MVARKLVRWTFCPEWELLPAGFGTTSHGEMAERSKPPDQGPAPSEVHSISVWSSGAWVRIPLSSLSAVLNFAYTFLFVISVLQHMSRPIGKVIAKGQPDVTPYSRVPVIGWTPDFSHVVSPVLYILILRMKGCIHGTIGLLGP